MHRQDIVAEQSLQPTSTEMETDDEEKKLDKPSPEMMIHLYCIYKNISQSSESELFRLISSFGFDKFDMTYSQFKKQNTIPVIGHKLHQCRIKPKNYKNTKPNTPDVTPTLPVPIYSVAEHLRLYLSTKDLATGIITQPTTDAGYSTFASGEFFKNLCQSLPNGVLPLCCTSNIYI